MFFKYINPGYVSLLDSDGQATATQITDSSQSKTGIAFKQTSSTAGVTLSNFAEGDEFWARFDVFIPNNTGGYFACYAPKCVSTGFSFAFPSSSNVNYYINAIRRNSNYSLTYGTENDLGINKNGVNIFVFHLTYSSGSGDYGVIEVSVNGDTYTSTSGNSVSYTSNESNKAKLYTTNAGVYFSNVIFSNAEISSKEQAVALPISGTETDMTLGENGIYVADAADQTILQSVDVTDLITNYGAGSKVTGISVVGNPAYKTATGLAKLTGISKSGNTVTTHGTVKLSSDTSAFVMDSWSLSDTTITDLQNMKFGWKVS